jgi:hypothetical protein
MPSDPPKPTNIYMAVKTMLRVHLNHSTSQHHSTAHHITAHRSTGHILAPFLCRSIDPILWRVVPPQLASHRIVGSEVTPCSKHHIASHHIASCLHKRRRGVLECPQHIFLFASHRLASASHHIICHALCKRKRTAFLTPLEWAGAKQIAAGCRVIPTSLQKGQRPKE